MDSFTPAQAYIALLIEYFGEDEALGWARGYAQAHLDIPPDASIFELVRINRNRKDELARVAKLLQSFVASVTPEFDIRSKSSEEVAKQLFVSRLGQYLDEACRPWAVCRMIHPIEFLYDFPEWLGDMYNACDYLKPDTRPVDCRHLEQAIRAHLKDL